MLSEPSLNPESDHKEKDESEASQHYLEQPVIVPEPEVQEEVQEVQEEEVPEVQEVVPEVQEVVPEVQEVEPVAVEEENKMVE